MMIFNTANGILPPGGRFQSLMKAVDTLPLTTTVLGRGIVLSVLPSATVLSQMVSDPGPPPLVGTVYNTPYCSILNWPIIGYGSLVPPNPLNWQEVALVKMSSEISVITDQNPPQPGWIGLQPNLIFSPDDGDIPVVTYGYMSEYTNFHRVMGYCKPGSLGEGDLTMHTDAVPPDWPWSSTTYITEPAALVGPITLAQARHLPQPDFVLVQQLSYEVHPVFNLMSVQQTLFASVQANRQRSELGTALYGPGFTTGIIRTERGLIKASITFANLPDAGSPCVVNWQDILRWPQVPFVPGSPPIVGRVKFEPSM